MKASEARKRGATILACRTHYEVLQVPLGASEAEVRAAHRTLASVFHPDKPNGSHDVMARINDAYTCLTDKVARRKYDAVQKTAASACPTCEGKGWVWKQQGFKAKQKRSCPTCGGSGTKEPT